MLAMRGTEEKWKYIVDYTLEKGVKRRVLISNPGNKSIYIVIYTDSVHSRKKKTEQSRKEKRLKELLITQK